MVNKHLYWAHLRATGERYSVYELRCPVYAWYKFWHDTYEPDCVLAAALTKMFDRRNE